MNRRGFTLLEVLVATVIMAVAVVGLLSALTTSLHNAARLTDYDRAVLLGRQKMDELLIADKLPKLAPFEGTWPADLTGGLPIGWRAQLTPFEIPPNAGPGAWILERIQLEIWWGDPDRRRKFALEGFRRTILTPADMAAGVVR